MDIMPKRRKSKDNPYILSKDETNNIYLVSFVDGTNTYRSIRVSKEVYAEMDYFERRDLSQMNEYDNHIEHSEIYDYSLNSRVLHKSLSLEDEIILKASFEDLRKAIEKLPNEQKRRIKKYYFNELNESEIALQEGTTQQAISYSLNYAKNNLRKILKNF